MVDRGEPPYRGFSDQAEEPGQWKSKQRLVPAQAAGPDAAAVGWTLFPEPYELDGLELVPHAALEASAPTGRPDIG